VCSSFIRPCATLFCVGKWTTVTVVDPDGRHHSLDVVADSSYDAAHLFLTSAKMNGASMLPVPTRETTFEVVSDREIYRVTGEKLREWILKRRGENKGPQAAHIGLTLNLAG
jgi:hypothetical protein